MVNQEQLSVFKGKRVLVTGDTGFKGSWLCLWLKELGADVVGYSLSPKSDRDHFNLLHLENEIQHVDGNVCDAEHLKETVDGFQPEFLFHLAAQSLVRFSYDNPKLTFDTNVGGSVNVLESVRSCPSLRSLVYITSDKCYFNKEWVWGYREQDELGGIDPYSASKAAAEKVFQAYTHSYFRNRKDFGAATARAGNVIGGGDWAQDRIVPDAIKGLMEKKPIVLRNPKSTRPWQHVLEPVGAYLLLACRLYGDPSQYSGSWNFGPRSDSIRTVEDLSRDIIRHWGSGDLEIHENKSAPHEARLLQLNCDKASQLLGWKPHWDFDRTVEETVHWYHSIFVGKKATDVSRQQIQSYMETQL